MTTSSVEVCPICGKPYDDPRYHRTSPHDGSHFVCVFPPAPEALDALADRVNTNVERMEQSQRVSPETMNITFDALEQKPRFPYFDQPAVAPESDEPTTKLDADLLPCPFKREGEVHEPQVTKTALEPHFYSVVCNGCCSIAYGNTRSKVIERWNTRACTPASGDAKEQARELVDAFRFGYPPVQSLRFLEWEPLVDHITTALEGARAERGPLKLTKPNGAWIDEVREQVLIQSPCGVSGHFRFQLNGGNCLMCQKATVAEANAAKSASRSAREAERTRIVNLITTRKNLYALSRNETADVLRIAYDQLVAAIAAEGERENESDSNS